MLITYLDRLTPQLNLSNTYPQTMWPQYYKIDRQNTQQAVKLWYKYLEGNPKYAGLKRWYDRIQLDVLKHLERRPDHQQLDLWDAVDKQKARDDGEVYWNTKAEKAKTQSRLRAEIENWFSLKAEAIAKGWLFPDSDDDEAKTKGLVLTRAPTSSKVSSNDHPRNTRAATKAATTKA